MKCNCDFANFGHALDCPARYVTVDGSAQDATSSVVKASIAQQKRKQSCRHDWEEIIDDGDEVKVKCKICGKSKWVYVAQ